MLINSGNYFFVRRNNYGHLTYQAYDGCLLSGQADPGYAAASADGVASSYIQYLDIIEKLEKQGIQVKVSDVSDALSLPRPGVTRTVKDMEAKGYVKKFASAEDGRVTYLTVTEAGKALSEKYNKQYFTILSGYVDSIPEEDILCTIRTMEKFYKIMCERRIDLDK